MKILNSRLKQIIIEEIEKINEKGEGEMADRQLDRIADLAYMIDEMVSNETDLEEWVESKITKAHDYLSTVLDYLKGKKLDRQEDILEQ